MDESREYTRRRIFIGFSSLDRYSIIESIICHLANYGMSIWYDRHQMRIGDSYIDNFNDGIIHSDYAIIVFSQHTNSADFFKEEIKYIYNQYTKGEITIFPILYNTSINELNEEYLWIKDLVYKEINDSSGTLLICNHIMSRILTDEVNTCQFRTLNKLTNYYSCQLQDDFITNCLKSYLKIDNHNYNARVCVLYCLCLYIKGKYNKIKIIPSHYWKLFERLFSYTKLDINIDQRELLLGELTIIILLNVIQPLEFPL